PQFADPVGKAGRHVDGKRSLVARQNRIGPFKSIAVAVVDGDADEAPREVAFGEPPVHLVEADQVEVGAPDEADHVIEEARRDLEQAVGLEAVGAWRPYVVQRQYDTDSTHERPQKMVRGTEIQCLEAAANDGFLEPAQRLGLRMARARIIPT